MTLTTPPPASLSEATRANLRSLMARRNISRQQLADLTETNVTWVGRRLNGRYTLTLDDVDAFARALEVDPRDLIEVAS
jgi:transcriptional regulator with XRE-family HTH domain